MTDTMLREEMIRLAHRVPALRRHLVPILRKSAGEEGEEAAPAGAKKKGPPPNWDEFLKEKYDGGKKKIPNPNPKTRDKFKEVAVSTAMKDKGFMSKLMKEYSEWNKKKGPKNKGKGKSAPVDLDKHQADLSKGADKIRRETRMDHTHNDASAWAKDVMGKLEAHFDKQTEGLSDADAEQLWGDYVSENRDALMDVAERASKEYSDEAEAWQAENEDAGYDDMPDGISGAQTLADEWWDAHGKLEKWK